MLQKRTLKILENICVTSQKKKKNYQKYKI